MRVWPRLGVDVGATRIEAALVASDGRALGRASAATPSSSPQALIDRVVAMAERLGTGRRPAGIGVGFCGMVDRDRGIVMSTTDTLPGWTDVPLAAELEQRLGLPAAVDNDANAAALGEHRFGAGRGTGSLVMLTLGTGVGGAIVIDGRLVRGAGWMAGKLGHLKVRRGGRRCPCGARGCVEAYASAWAIRRRLGCDGRDALRLFRDGDPLALRTFHEAAGALGTLLADVANSLNPNLIVIGGGLAPMVHVMRHEITSRYREASLAEAFATTKTCRRKCTPSVGAALLSADRDL